MKKEYIQPQVKISITDFLDSFMEWISQGDDTGEFDSKNRLDEPDYEGLSDYGNLW